MALPIRNFVASQAVEQGMAKARVLRDNVQKWKTLADAGCTGDIIINSMQGIKAIRDILSSLVNVAGLNAAAQEEYDDPTLDFAAELNAVIAACDNCLSWVNSNYPKDVNGYLLDRKIVGGQVEFRAFSAAALSGLSAELATLLATFS